MVIAFDCMMIIFLVDYLPDLTTPGGGLQNYTIRIAEQLHALGENVCVITRHGTGNETYPFNVRKVSVSYGERKILQALKTFTLHKFDNSLTQILDAWLMRRECRRIKGINIIQSPNYKYPGLFVKTGRSKLIVRASSHRASWTEENKPSLDTRLTAWLEKRLFTLADAVFAPSKHLAGMLEAELGRTVDVVPTPIPTLEHAEDPGWYDAHLSDKKYILYFGTILERKGLFVLAEAMKRVWTEHPDILLVLAGPDLIVDGRSNLKRFMEILGENRQNLIHANNLPQAQLFPVIRNSHFVVLPSIEDNSPNSMLEAMALGKAVLGTTGSSLDEFYPPACQDLLVPRGEVEPLAAKIVSLWNLPDERLNEYGKALKQYVDEHHSPAAAAAALLEYYRRIIAQN